MVKKDVCEKYNDVGECIKWVTVDDVRVLKFKPEAIKCNPVFYKEWQDLVKNKRIKLMPTSDD